MLQWKFAYSEKMMLRNRVFKIATQRVISKTGRFLKGAAFGHMGFCTSWAVDVHDGSREWLEVTEVELHLKNLADEFRGKRIAHISDLHCGRTVSGKYLSHCVERINQLDCDIVVLTGDYITHDHSGRFRKKVVDLISSLRSRLGVFACLGNHDYGLGGVFRNGQDEKLEEMVAGMQKSDVTVLRNESSVLEIGGGRLRFVGLGDLWADDFEPAKAFAGNGESDAVIALSHNPETVAHLGEFDFDAVMCGHTHGMRTEWMSLVDGTMSNRRSYHAGLYHVGEKKVYVNRGLGRLGRSFVNARPEITVYKLA